jgi:diaminopimelate decarboxylase
MGAQNLISIAEQFGTPLYIYDAERIKENTAAILSALSYPAKKIYYAVMCNDHPEILKIIREAGLGVQINSDYELQIAKKAGFDPSDISFTSTGISRELMKKLIKENISINLDSVEETEKFCSSARNRTFGIRVQINRKIQIDKGEATNIYSESNVGIAEQDFPKIGETAKKTGNRITGIHGYLASNILDPKPFFEFGTYLADTASKFDDLEYVNFGSGFGVKCSEKDKDFDFQKVLRHYSSLLEKLSQSLGREIILEIEPGRAILADAGSLLVRITNIKKINAGKSEIAVNAGFAEFARPRIYNSYHEIEPLEKTGKPEMTCDIRGNTVLQNDFLGKDRTMEEVSEGDYLLIRKVGAYGIALASGFPGKKLPMQVLMNNGNLQVL